jgi:hypothetical protein
MGLMVEYLVIGFNNWKMKDAILQPPGVVYIQGAE